MRAIEDILKQTDFNLFVLYVVHNNTVVSELPAETATEHVILNAALNA